MHHADQEGTCLTESLQQILSAGSTEQRESLKGKREHHWQGTETRGHNLSLVLQVSSPCCVRLISIVIYFAAN